MITLAQFIRVCPQAKNAAAWVESLNVSMETVYADSHPRAIRFLAQFAHESAGFTSLEENLNYSAKGLLETFPKHFDLSTATKYARQPERIANRVYANRMGNGDEASGDGWEYRGRGAGITGRDNYARCSIAICLDVDTLIKNPELLVEPSYAAMAFSWFWSEHSLNALADASRFDAISDMINQGHITPREGDANGYADRLAWLKKFDEVMA